LNPQAPYTRTNIGIDTLDHELDIVVDLDGAWRFKDADLLETCVHHGRFSRAEADAITVEGQRLG
jgi:predicted RNA-binding protein associated with RNAse of E/G family